MVFIIVDPFICIRLFRHFKAMLEVHVWVYDRPGHLVTPVTPGPTTQINA